MLLARESDDEEASAPALAKLVAELEKIDLDTPVRSLVFLVRTTSPSRCAALCGAAELAGFIEVTLFGESEAVGPSGFYGRWRRAGAASTAGDCLFTTLKYRSSCLVTALVTDETE